MGASSLRFAHGRLIDGRITFEIVKQVPNEPKRRFWDIDLLVGFCQDALAYAKKHSATLAIDSWGVDHGFLDRRGDLVCGPVMYRDASHMLQYEKFAEHRRRLFELTGIAHQPFNTLYQLAARKEEDPTLPGRAEWYLIPDLMNFYLTGERRYESSNSSTSQLMEPGERWCKEAFELSGWPVPKLHPSSNGCLAGLGDGVQVLSIASHDTACAVVGVGSISESDAYLNVGTWALLGTVLDESIRTLDAEEGGWTNELGYRGSIRFLKNIPGFYVINRLHEELGISAPVGAWLDNRDKHFNGTFNPQDNALYNPDSMPEACSAICSQVPENDAQWAQAALQSLVKCVARDIPNLEAVVSRKFGRLRVVGGGSRSAAFCQELATATRLHVVAGPVEATVLGNLAMQFAASGEINPEDVPAVVSTSTAMVEYKPEGDISASI